MDAGIRDHLNPNPRWTLPAELSSAWAEVPFHCYSAA